MSKNNNNDTPRLFEVEEYVSFRRKDTTTYDAFVKKFKPNNGSDECYTPDNIYQCVYNYVRCLFPQFGEFENLRPFKPNGNFLREDYSNKIVIDNPPFSILSNIVNYYQQHNIKFWLFATALTIMGYYAKCDIVITNTAIQYTNGAKIATSFITNMYSDKRIVLDGILQQKIEQIKGVAKKKLLNRYPFILSGARLQKWVTANNIITIKQEDTLPIISRKFTVYGNGCYVRAGVLPAINADNSELTEDEKIYLQNNKFKPTC